MSTLFLQILTFLADRKVFDVHVCFSGFRRLLDFAFIFSIFLLSEIGFSCATESSVSRSNLYLFVTFALTGPGTGDCLVCLS